MEIMKKKNRVNWELLDKLLNEKGYTKAEVSKMMGYSISWLSNRSNDNRLFNIAQLTQLAMILGVDKEALIMPETTHKEPVSEEIEDGFEPSQFEIDVLEMLKAIKQKVDSDHEILMYLFNEKQQGVPEEPEEKEEEPIIDELETSMSTLKELLENRTAVRFDEYKEKAMERGVTDLQVIDAVIAKLGHHKMTRGYGRNKTVWIYRQGDVNA
jgi:transcriptional regulator with XRE-family HTH domain